MSTTTVEITFPDIDDPAAAEQAESLLSELKQEPKLPRAYRSRQDRPGSHRSGCYGFWCHLNRGTGTPAVIILAGVIMSWVERTGTSTIKINDVRIENVRSSDVADIVKALEKRKTGAKRP